MLTNQLSFEVLGRGQQRGSKRAVLIPKRGGGWVTKNGRPIVAAKDDNEKSKAWMQEVRFAAMQARREASLELITDPIVLTAKFCFLRPASHYGSGRNSTTLKPSAPVVHAQSPDLAKLLRSLEDALTRVIWLDDKLVRAYGNGTGRYWCEDYERTEVLIEW